MVSRMIIALRIMFLPVFLVVHRKEYRTTTQLRRLEESMRTILSKYQKHSAKDSLDFDRTKSFGNKIISFLDRISEKREQVLPLVRDKGDFFCLTNGLWLDLFNLNIEIDEFSEKFDEYIYTVLDSYLKACIKEQREIIEARKTAASNSDMNNEENAEVKKSSVYGVLRISRLVPIS